MAAEITPHADGRAAGAPALSLTEMLEMRQRLDVTGVDTTDAESHVHTNVVCARGGVGYDSAPDVAGVVVQERVWATMTDPEAVSSSKEHQQLAALFETHAGDLENLVLATPADYYVSLAKVKAKNPTTGRQFAWQVVEGYYTKDEGGI